MLLLIDMGNTNCKWALVRSDATNYAQESCDKEWDSGSWQNQDYDSEFWLRQLSCFQDKKISNIVISSVASDEVKSFIRDWCLQSLALEPLYAESADKYVSLNSNKVLINSYQEPLALGVDRWLGMIASFELTIESLQTNEHAFAVFDIGTAITLDLVSTEGLHLGGHIVPGQQLMVESLFSDTGRIAWGAALDPQKPIAEQWLGLNSQQAVELGALQAARGYLESCLARLNAHYQIKNVLFTGGGVQSLTHVIDLPSELNIIKREHLVLEGLLHWYLMQK